MKIRRGLLGIAAVILAGGIGLTGCFSGQRDIVINLNNLSNDYPRAVYTGIDSKSSLARPLRVAAAPVISPQEGYKAYTDLVQYLSSYLQHPVEFITRQTYAEVNLLMNSGDIDVAFVCTYAYVRGQRDFGMELVAAPEVNGRAEYASYIIVSRTSPVNNFAGLKGKRFAFTDPMSLSGRLVPLYLLQELGEIPESFFSSYIFTYSHDKSIRAVADGIVDGAAVDSLVYEAFAREHPDITNKIKVIQKSRPFASPPVVMRPTLDPSLKKEIRSAFLFLHKTPAGAQIVSRLGVDRFINIEDEAYNSVREIARRVGYL